MGKYGITLGKIDEIDSKYMEGFMDGMAYHANFIEEKRISVCLQPKPRWLSNRAWQYLIKRLIYIKEVK